MNFLKFINGFLDKLRTIVFLDTLQAIIYKIQKKLFTITINNNKNIQLQTPFSNRVSFSKDIFKYITKNKTKVKNYFQELDIESKRTVKKVIERIYFIHTQYIFNKNDLLTKEEKKKKVEISKLIKE